MKKEDRYEIARIYLMENGFAELLPKSKVLQNALKIAAGYDIQDQAVTKK